MIDSLVRLVELGAFAEGLQLAEKMIGDGEGTPQEMAWLNLISCRCRLGLDDPFGAAAAGHTAVQLAQEAGQFDLLGRALLHLGTAYVGMRQFDEALGYFHGYFEYLPRYRESRRLEGAIWRHIGVTHQRNLQPDRAVEALRCARSWFAAHGVDQSVFTVTHDLILTYLQMHELDPCTSLATVPKLLLQQRAMARRMRGQAHYEATYRLDLAAYCLHRRRYPRAISSARKAMAASPGALVVEVHAELIIHRSALATGAMDQALAHALAARDLAAESGQYELELLANQAVAQSRHHLQVERH